MKVSAIISTFNSSKFIGSCIWSLLDQTLYQKGDLEIIIIDSGSEENEDKIVKQFQKSHQRIKYLRTEKRETLYQAWNRGISLSEGEFITNANTDDTHDEDCLEILSIELSQNKDFGLVYGNVRKVFNSKETKISVTSIECKSQKFFSGSLFVHYPYGAQPMWRKSLHERIGLFNSKLSAVGDYEFALRLVENGINSKYVPNAWGNMRWRTNAISTTDSTAINEKVALHERFRNLHSIQKAYLPYLPTLPKYSNENYFNECLLDLGLRGSCFFSQFSEVKSQTDLSLLNFAYSANISDRRLLNNRLLYHLLSGEEVDASTIEYLKKSVCDICNHNLTLFEGKNKKGKFLLFGPSYDFPSEMELKETSSSYLKFKKERQDDEFTKIRIFSFDLEKFFNCNFKDFTIDDLILFDSIFIWGMADKSKIFINLLESSILEKISLIDSNPLLKEQRLFEKPILSFSKIKKNNDFTKTAFILGMNSIHKREIEEQIREKFINPTIFNL